MKVREILNINDLDQYELECERRRLIKVINNQPTFEQRQPYLPRLRFLNELLDFIDRNRKE